MFKVTIKDGVSHKHVAVSGVKTIQEAECVVLMAGHRLSGAETYKIDAYGARFCELRLTPSVLS